MHIAVVKPGKRLRILKTLLADSRIDINEKDLSGLAPLDVVEKHSEVEGVINLLHQDPRIHIVPQIRNSVDAVALLQQVGDERARHFDKQQVLRNLDTMEMELQLKCAEVY